MYYKSKRQILLSTVSEALLTKDVWLILKPLMSKLALATLKSFTNISY